MTLSREFRDLLRSFNEAGVEYVVVGGYAVGIHGWPRYTDDLDLLVIPTNENGARIKAALTAFGLPESDVSALIIEECERLRIGDPPNRIDIFTSISGLDAREAIGSHELVEVCPGMLVPVIGLDQLITNKRAAGRGTHLGDAENLERIRAERATNEKQ
jgi:predicted nucleotidyltransferase